MSTDFIAEAARRLVKIFPYVVQPLALEAELKVPVINTKLVGIRQAETMVLGKSTHSIKSYPHAAGLTPESVSKRESK